MLEEVDVESGRERYAGGAVLLRKGRTYLEVRKVT